MAWSISISPEGWDEIYEALQASDKKFLFSAVNEVRKQTNRDLIPENMFNRITTETLADEAFGYIQTTNTCDNGGYNYWIDTWGNYKVRLTDEP